MSNRTKLYKKEWGANIIVAIEADSNDSLNKAYNNIYNFGGCSSLSELDYFQNKDKHIGLFQTQEKLLIKGLINYIQFRYIKYCVRKRSCYMENLSKYRDRIIKSAVNKYSKIIQDDSLILSKLSTNINNFNNISKQRKNFLTFQE